MDMRIPPLKIKILLESNPLKSRISSREIGRHHPLSASPGLLPPRANTTAIILILIHFLLL